MGKSLVTVHDRAQQAAQDAYVEYVTGSAEMFERTLVALALISGGVLFLPLEALTAAEGFSIDTEAATDGVVLRVSQGSAAAEDRPSSPVGSAADTGPRVPAAEIDFGIGPLVEDALAPKEEDPVEEEEIDQSPEAREQRYLEERANRKAQPVGAVNPAHQRAWDQEGDTQWQDAGVEQPEKKGGPLLNNDGSISVNAR